MSPYGLEVNLRISGPIRVEGNCPASDDNDIYYDRNRFLAEGCAPGGDASVALVVKSTGVELDRINIHVAPDPTPTPTATVGPGCSNGVAVPNPADNPDLVSDCEILLEALSVLTNEEESALNWSDEKDITNWRGVEVSGTPKRVAELNLQFSGLKGTIPPELGELDLSLIHI